MTPVYILQTSKLQRCLTAIETRCESWKLNTSKDKIQVIYFSHRLRPCEDHRTLNEPNIAFVNLVKYLGVIFDKRITRRLHIEMIESKAIGKFIRIYSLFKSERLGANVKLTLLNALIKSVMTYARPAWELAADTYLL
jgi:hypothetical protein